MSLSTLLFDRVLTYLIVCPGDCAGYQSTPLSSLQLRVYSPLGPKVSKEILK